MPIQLRLDRRTPGTDTWGVPDVTWEEDSQDHPTILDTFTIPSTQTPRAFLSQHPNTGDYPNAYLVHRKSSKGNNRDQNIWYTYMTLPGPWIYDRILGPNGIVTESKHRKVLPSTYPAGGTGITRDEVQQLSVTLAEESIVSYTDGSGNLVSPPIYVNEQADALTAWTSTFKTYRQEQGGASPVMPNIDEVYGTCKLIGSGASTGIDSAVVDAPGMDYTSLPTVVPAASYGGSGAVLAASSLKAVSADLVGGATITAGATITFAGGTFSSAATATAGNSTLLDGSVDDPDTSNLYEIGDLVELAGGTPATIPAVNTITYYLQASSAYTKGAGYLVNNFITLNAGTLVSGNVAQVIRVLAINGTGGVTRWSFETDPATESSYTTNQSTPCTQASTDGAGTGFSLSVPQWRKVITTTPSRLGRAVVSITGVTYLAGNVLTPGSGYRLDPGTPANTSVITLAGGTFSSAAVLAVTRVTLISAAIGSGGSGYVVDELVSMKVVTGTSYSYAVVKVLTLSGSAVATFSIMDGGSFDTSEQNFNQQSTTGAGTGLTLVTPVFGVKQYGVNSGGAYTATPTVFTQGSVTGAGTPSGATFSGVYNATTVAVTDGGSYSVPASSFTQYSTTGSGTGIVIDASDYDLLALTLLSGGVYTVVPSNPVTGNSGMTSITANLSFGLNAISVTTPGTLYPGGNLTLTISGGGGTGAKGHGIVQPQDWREQTAVIVDGRLENQPNSPKSMKVWVTMPNAIPPWKEYDQIPYQYPAILVILTQSSPFARPAPGYDFTFLPQRQAVDPALTINEGVNGMPSDIPPVFAMISPAAISRYFPITPNTQHPAFSWFSYTNNGDGTITIDYPESFPASTPYVQGQTIIVRSDAVRLRGNMWKKFYSNLNENGPLY